MLFSRYNNERLGKEQQYKFIVPMPDKLFWDNRYQKNETGWDAGSITTPLKEFFDTLHDKSIKILIPGGGNSYEAEYLHKAGFDYVYVLDISEHPLINLKKRVPDFPSAHIIHGDFFGLGQKFDLIVEQTFFCALDPQLRQNYALKMCDLLKKGGALVGLLFDVELNKDKPPYGGSKDEYIPYFRPYFEFKKFEKAYNSIPPRAGNELFIHLIKK